jgi:hypothetical protein
LSKRTNAQIPPAIAWFLREISFAANDVREWRTTLSQAIAGVNTSNVISSKSFEESTEMFKRRLMTRRLA